MGEFPSGQRGQTVNLLSLTSLVRIQLPPPNKQPSPCGSVFCLARLLIWNRHTECALVRILGAERVKLACKRQAKRIFAKGEYPASLSFSRVLVARFFVWWGCLFGTGTRSVRWFAFLAQSASSSLVSGKPKESSPKANTQLPYLFHESLWLGFLFI